MISEECLKNIPEKPGIYLMKDKGGKIIYIGKAISLKKRVKSYFGKAAGHNPKLGSLVPQIHDIDYMITSSELEALILENNLIKRYKPKYNVVLRDDKNYPYLCLTMNDEYPRLTIARKVRKDGNLYFGPYIPANALRKTLKTIYQLFPLRQCKKLKKRDRPCLQNQMKRCEGPCAGVINPEDYRTIVQEVKLFLLGKKQHLLSSLERRMQEASEKLEYEKAARIRDQIQSIRKVLQSQSVFSTQLKNKDIINYARSGEMIAFVVFFVRYGQLLGKKDFLVTVPQSISDEEALESFLKQFYTQEIIIPRTILLGHPLSEGEIIQSWLSEKRGSAVTLAFPKSGEGKNQLEMVKRNAQTSLESQLKKVWHGEAILRLLVEDLHLRQWPSRIEAFDISNLFGDEAVGSMVCWIDGQPVKSEYRKYKIKNVSGINDYAMIRETIHRRYSRLLQEKKKLPDLILIDGGKGHLRAGLDTLQELNLPEVPVISLAKKEEEIFLSPHEEPLRLDRSSPSLQLLQRIRDESHRFAISYHRQRRLKGSVSSQLLQIEGIGRARERALLIHFGSLGHIKEAGPEELASVPNIDKRTAQRIFQFFHPQKG